MLREAFWGTIKNYSDFFAVVWDAIVFLYVWSPLWLPLFLLYIFWTIWMNYAKKRFVLKQGSVLLEIKMPREITKSPLAMEIVLTSLYQTGSASYIEAFIDGKVRPWFSLEMVSHGGDVRFYIWTQTKWKNLIEAQIYAQYPEVEIYEVEDYTKDFEYDPSKHVIWCTHYKLTNPDVYPIKTYIDYGLDKNEKEEYKIDPITAILEYLGSIKKGDRAWFQILIQAHRKEGAKDLRLSKKPDWKVAAEKELQTLRDKLKTGGENAYPRIPTKGEAEVVAAIERSISKWPFDCMIRGAYLATKENFNSVYISGLIGSFRQFSTNSGLNSFKLGFFTDFDYPWQDFRRIRRTKIEHEFLDAYRRRSFFQHPYKNWHAKPFVLNTEELATIYHFPGAVASTPTLTRIPSKKSEAPSNLPI